VTVVSPNKQAVTQLLKNIETGDPAPVAAINPNKYIQHNRVHRKIDIGGELWSAQAASSIKAAKGEGRVWARGTPLNQATKRTTVRATAMRTCCRWVLAWPM
jgi:hypothetical protein